MRLTIDAKRIRLLDKPTQVDAGGELKLVARPGTVVVSTEARKGSLILFDRSTFTALFPDAELDAGTREYTLPEPEPEPKVQYPFGRPLEEDDS